jgi:hypothetical protein
MVFFKIIIFKIYQNKFFLVFYFIFILLHQNHKKTLKKYQFNVFFKPKTLLKKYLNAEAEVMPNTS